MIKKTLINTSFKLFIFTVCGISFLFCAALYAPAFDNLKFIKFIPFVNYFFKTSNHSSFYYPSGVAVDFAGNVFVADIGNHAIRKITQKGAVSTFAGKIGVPGNIDGEGTLARFQAPAAIAISKSGNIYVADQGNSMVRKILPTGFVTTLCGLAGNRGFQDGVGKLARFSYPTGIAVDQFENVYVADSGNDIIRKISPVGKVTTIAGVALAPGSAEESFGRYNVPKGIAVDNYGNIYVADSNNHSIRKITPKAELSTYAGYSTEPGILEGFDFSARFKSPSALVMGASGQLFIADTGNHTIRKVSKYREVTTLAGQPGIPGMSDGIGMLASFKNPVGIAVDNVGNIYVADSSNNTIRKILVTTGEVQTIAGIPGKRGSANTH